MGQRCMSAAMIAALAIAGACASIQDESVASPSPSVAAAIEIAPPVEGLQAEPPSVGSPSTEAPSLTAIAGSGGPPDHLVSESEPSPVPPSPVTPLMVEVSAALAAPPAPAPAPKIEPRPSAASPELSPAAVAGAFLTDINSSRARSGRAALVRDADLDAMARSWAATMAAAGSLRHSNLIYDVIDQGWSVSGENVGWGPGESSIFAGFDSSAGHHANMVNGDYTHVGIGVVVVGPVVWTTHLFAG